MLPEMPVEIGAVVVSAGEECFRYIEISIGQHFAGLVDPYLNQKLGESFVGP